MHFKKSYTRINQGYKHQRPNYDLGSQEIKTGTIIIIPEFI